MTSSTEMQTIQELQAKVARLEQQVNTTSLMASLGQTSKIFPKKRIVVFVGKSYFGDNIKYAFLAFCAFAQENDIACYFLTEDPSQLAMLASQNLPHLSMSGNGSGQNAFNVLLETAVIVLSNHFRVQAGTSPLTYGLLQGAKQVQLWHGTPLKEIGLHFLCSIEVMAACGPCAAMVATNASSRDAWAKRFAFNDFSAIGYPRNDAFFREPTPLDLLNVDMENFNLARDAKTLGKPVILYAPTFRDHAGPVWIENAGLSAIANHCMKKDYTFFVNMHPFEQKTVPELRQKYPTAKFIAPGTDAYPLTAMTDVLITDYSSIAFDFLLVDRPLIFYRPDHADYIAKSRPLIKDREHYSSGPIASRVDELLPEIDRAVSFISRPEDDSYGNARKSLCSELFDHRDGHAGQRLCSLILNQLDGVV